MHSDSENYEEIKNRALKDYKKIKKMRCPVLNNEYIHFNNIGFRHLIRKQVMRSYSEQVRRFSLVSYITDIITDPKTELEYRKNVLNGSVTEYWTLKKVKDGILVKAVIRQMNKGQKHFYSIMTAGKSK
ncbi:MAG: hypothetical protein JWM39_376 [Parcubacteria group bacterium]|nr:hypothetical protein [Parcubacteria group bacterium]